MEPLNNPGCASQSQFVESPSRFLSKERNNRAAARADVGIEAARRTRYTGSGVDQSHLLSRNSLFFINERTKGVDRRIQG